MTRRTTRKKRGMPQAKKETQKNKRIFFLAVVVIVIALAIMLKNNHQATGQFSGPGGDDKCPPPSTTCQESTGTGKTVSEALRDCYNEATKPDAYTACGDYCTKTGKGANDKCEPSNGEPTVTLDLDSVKEVRKKGLFKGFEFKPETEGKVTCTACAECDCTYKGEAGDDRKRFDFWIGER